MNDINFIGQNIYIIHIFQNIQPSEPDAEGISEMRVHVGAGYRI